MLKGLLKNWGRLNSKHPTDGWRVFGKDISEFLVDSVVMYTVKLLLMQKMQMTYKMV
jgi:hypothetical protein